MVDSRQMILSILRGTHQRVLRCVQDLSDAEAQQSPTGSLTPVIWQIGHLAFTDARLAARVDCPYPLSSSYEELFKGGTGGPGAYLPLSEVTTAFNTTNQTLEEAVKSVDLSRPVDARTYTNVGEMFMFACYHRGYHTGKMATLRALLGKPRLFG